MGKISGDSRAAARGPILGAVPGLTALAVRLESPADHVCFRSRPSPGFPVLTTRAAMGSLHQPVLVNEVVAWLTPLEGRFDHRRRDGRRRRSCRGAGAPGGIGRAGDRAGPRPGDAGPGRRAVGRARPAGDPGPRGLCRDGRRCSRSWGSIGCRGYCWTWGSRRTSSPGKAGGSASRPTGRSTCGSIPNRAGPTAADLVNRLLEAEDLAQLFFEFGEERFSRRIARRIVETRQNGPDPDHRPARRAGAPERPRPGPARADRPGHPRLPGAADRGQRRARPARRRARGDPRGPGARADGPRSSASTRWKTAASSGRSRPIPG